MNKPILVLDFDGVIHGYQSGWKGAAVIPDDPVPGALEFIVRALERFEVHILSSRSHQWGGKRAMKKWLRKHLGQIAHSYETAPEWWQNRIATESFADPWPEDVYWTSRRIVGEIKWPWFKPPALVTIDDRAMTFNGQWPTLDTIKGFKPWNKR